MKAIRHLVVGLVVCLVAFTAACGERAPTAPPPPDASLIGSLLQATGLVKCSSLPEASVTQTIGTSGGTIRVGPHTLTVPAGALSGPVAITGEIGPPGKGVNVVHFEPAGLTFAKPASLTMSYANCNLLGSLAPKRIAYVTDKLDILYFLLSVDNLLARKVTGRVNHFSDYAVSW